MPYGRRTIVFFSLLLKTAAQFVPDKLEPQPVCTAVDKQDCKEKASLCAVPAYVKLMSKLCPATCGLCIQPMPPTPPSPPPQPPPATCTAVDKQTDCKEKASLCTVPAYVKLMSQICPATCGHCIPPTTPPTAPPPPPPPAACTAVDKQAGCKEKASLCTVPAYAKLMSQVCAATCGYCIQPTAPPTSLPPPPPPSPLVCTTVDKQADCKEKASLCTVPAYVKLMSQICPATCGHCIQTTTPPLLPPSPACTAVDKAPDCKEKAFLCTNTAYKKLMSQVCAATCGLCGTPPPPSPPAATCSDKSLDCGGKTVLCHQAAYKKLMTELCAATCKFC